MAANDVFIFHCFMFVNTGGGGLKTAVNGPAGLVRLRAAFPSGVYASAYDTNVTQTASTGVLQCLQVSGYVVNGANAGTFAFRFAQNTSNITGCTIEQRSWLEYRKL